MYNFNRSPFPGGNPLHMPMDPMTPGPGFSPHNSTPRSPYLNYTRLPPPGLMPDQTFSSPRGDSYSFNSPRFPQSGHYPSPFAPAAQTTAPFPWSPIPRSPYAPRFNSPSSHESSPYVFRTASPQSRDDPESSYRYDSSASNYVTGFELGNSGAGTGSSIGSSRTTFGSARSNRTASFGGRGAGYSGTPRWKRGDPITRSLSDPWADLTPIRTPEPGGCLVANPLVQRHTVLFAPREQRRRKAAEADLEDPDRNGAPEPKRLPSPSILTSTSPA